MNLYDKLVMDAVGNSGGKEAARTFKHIGMLKQDSAPVVIMFRTIPKEPNFCLVVGPKFLPEINRGALMRALESSDGQASFELGTYLARLTFQDGVNMLASLHVDNYLKKFLTKDIIVTYGAGDAGKIALDTLNQMIADDMKVSIEQLAVTQDIVLGKKEKANKKSNAKEAAKN